MRVIYFGPIAPRDEIILIFLCPMLAEKFGESRVIEAGVKFQ
jgi:hypothetical protein